MTEATGAAFRLGVCVVLHRRDHVSDQVLMGLRLGSHGAGTWSFPGGHVDFGEDPLDSAVREVREETGIALDRGGVEALTFTRDVFEMEGRRYVTLYFIAECPAGQEPEVMEPGKCGGWRWVRPDVDGWPEPLFLPVRNFLAQIEAGSRSRDEG